MLMKRRFCIFASLVISASCAFAQEAGAPAELRFVAGTSPALTSSNPAAISTFGQGRVSVAEISADKGNGGLIPISGSKDDVTGGALTESYARISDKIAFHGLLSYSYFSGKEMGGSILMDPYFNPVNFYEASETDLGTKNKEMYHLTGDMAYSFNDRWSAGIGFDYESGDQVKVKDPRFHSKWMDMKVTPGIWFSPSGSWSMGVALVMRSTLEQVKGGIYGTTDRQYSVYTDKGNFFGSMEELNGDYNYMPASSFRPMKNSFTGLSFQTSRTGDVSLFQELNVLSRKGYYGKKASSTATFFEFNGIELSYKLAAMISGDVTIHKFGLDASIESLSSVENLFKYTTPEGQATVVEYYGVEDISRRNISKASLAYEGWSGVSGIRPQLSWGAEVGVSSLTNKMTFYPLFRNHDHTQILASAHAEKNFIGSGSMFTAGAGLDFMAGSGTEAEDGSSVSSTTSLISFDNYMHRQFEYDTASRAGLSLKLKYTHFVSSKMAVYVSLDDTFASMLAAPVYLESKTRNVATVTVGCSF